jgi:hypothetical protein
MAARYGLPYANSREDFDIMRRYGVPMASNAKPIPTARDGTSAKSIAIPLVTLPTKCPSGLVPMERFINTALEKK